ncbi:MAG: aminotransferase class V-fold PLP-dependent enzyme [Bacteroidota bacterium]
MELLKKLFYLNPEVTFLNHGSFGACPKPVMDVYQNWQIELEKQPVEFLGRKHGDLLYESRKALADYVSCDFNNLVFVANATYAINIVSHSLKLLEDDEVLSTNLEYGAMDRMWRIICERKGASYIRAKISLPIREDKFVENFWKNATDKTKVIFLSHITSSTALLLPLQKIIDKARKKGIITIIDGAHIPGQVPLDLDKLGCDFYTGNCHKWLMAPKGAAFLYVRKEKQDMLKPFLISWGRDEFLSDSAFIDEFEYQGTRDIAAFLSVPAAIFFHHENVKLSVKKNIYKLLSYVQKGLGEILKTPPIVNKIPENMQMYAHPLPKHIDGKSIKLKLYDQFNIEVPVSTQNNVEYIRVSIHIYNTKSEIDYFLDALRSII